MVFPYMGAQMQSIRCTLPHARHLIIALGVAQERRCNSSSVPVLTRPPRAHQDAVRQQQFIEKMISLAFDCRPIKQPQLSLSREVLLPPGTMISFWSTRQQTVGHMVYGTH